MTTDKDAPAFPQVGRYGQSDRSGFTAREYAAIKLRVPDSGTDWLDKMILASLRDEIAIRVMPIMLELCSTKAAAAREAASAAIAMLAERIKT